MKHTITIIFVFLYCMNINLAQNSSTSKIQDSTMIKVKKTTVSNGISEIRIKEPLLIKNVDSKRTFWDYFAKISVIIGLLGGMLGIVVTGYAIHDRWFKDSEIHSKIISFAAEDGTFEIMKIKKPINPEIKYGIKYFVKLSINVTRKDLNFSDIEILLKYKNIDSIFKGAVYSPRNYSIWTIEKVKHQLILPQENLLYYKSVLKQNTTHLEYINFIVFDETEIIKNKLKGDDLSPEYIQLVFKSSEKSFMNNKSSILKTNKMSLDKGIEKYIWEDEIWIKK